MVIYKIFLVDDEIWIVEGLITSINWQEYGFEVIGTSLNGLDALEKILETKPDLVFTDIRMPGINGLELIKKCSSILPNTAFIVLSGYAEFSYAKEAMQYGAMGYCLKPINEDEIISLLKKVKTFLGKVQASNENDLLAYIGNFSMVSREKASHILAAKGLYPEEGKSIIPIVSIGPEKIIFPGAVRAISLNLGLDKKGYLVQCDEERDIHEFLEKAIGEIIPGIGVGKEIESIDKIRDNLESAIVSAYHCFCVGRPMLYKADKIIDANIGDTLTLLEEKIVGKDMVETDKIINTIIVKFKEGRYNIKHAFIIYNTIMSILYKGTSEQYEDFVFNYEQLVKMFGNAENMFMNLKKSILRDINFLRNNLTMDIKNEYFREVIKYIDENFYKDISIQFISQKFCISLSYICQLFKKEMDTTFTNYLRRLRISYACKLLNETDLSINEISERAGFTDYFYFSRIFKKYTQTTPSLYRNTTDKKTLSC